MRSPISIFPAVLLAACSEAPPVAEEAVANRAAGNTVATAPPDRDAGAPARAAAAQAVKEATADFDFAYSYPAAAAAIAPLDAWLKDDRAEVRASVAKDAAAFRKEMAAGGFPFRKYESTTEWQVVTETPRLLSLSAKTYDYFGGAHGSPGFRALLWDKAKARRLAPTDVFTSEAALQRAAGARFCDLLDAERAGRRGAPVVRSGDGFDKCIAVREATVILGSTDRRTIDRIGFLIGPYAAGPFAEGTYELTMPVTPALLAAVKPEWRDAFRVR